MNPWPDLIASSPTAFICESAFTLASEQHKQDISNASMHSDMVSAFSHSNFSSDFAKTTNKPGDETIASSNFEEVLDFLNQNSFVDVLDQCADYNDDVDMAADQIWKNWLNFDVLPASACMYSSPNSLPNTNTRRPTAIDTSFIQPSPLSFVGLALDDENEHDLCSFYQNNHVNEQLDIGILDILSKKIFVCQSFKRRL